MSDECKFPVGLTTCGYPKNAAPHRNKSIPAYHEFHGENGPEKQSIDYCAYLAVAEQVFQQYKQDQPKWWKRMDGTPILNDIAVRMAEAFLATDPRRPSHSKSDLMQIVAEEVAKYETTGISCAVIVDRILGVLAADPRSTAPLAELLRRWRNVGSDPEVQINTRNLYAELADELEAALALAGEPPTHKDVLAKWMIEHGFATGHGDTVAGLLKELSWQVIELQKKSHKTPAEWVRVGLEAAALVAEDEWKLDAHEEGHREFCAKYGTADVEEAIRAIDAVALVGRAGEEQK
jgi:hypothetical protein